MRIMRLTTGEFTRRFMIRVLPDGFHRIRHYGQLIGTSWNTNISSHPRPNETTPAAVIPDVRAAPAARSLSANNAPLLRRIDP